MMTTQKEESSALSIFAFIGSMYWPHQRNIIVLYVEDIPGECLFIHHNNRLLIIGIIKIFFMNVSTFYKRVYKDS
jgi:hypothetical protein